MQRTRPVALVLAAVSGSVVVAVSCLGDASGPASSHGILALAPSFAHGAAGVVDVDRIRVFLTRQPAGDVVIDQVFDVGDDGQVDLTLRVVVGSPEDVFLLTLALINPQGDTVFRFGPAEVVPTPSGQQPAPIPVELQYTGVGFDAAAVQFVTPTTRLEFGETGQVEAQALDDAGMPIPGTPIIYTGLDPAVLRVLDEATGGVEAQTEPGFARVEARLLTGQTDTLTLTVGPAPPPGRDVVVFNDINVFDNTAMMDPNNQLLVENLVNFTAPGPRDAGRVVWWDAGRNSTCGTGECALNVITTMATAVRDAGFTIVEIFSEAGSLIDIAPDVKLIFLWTPNVAYTAEEISELKRFSADGGRIIFIGEHDGFYAGGIPIENQFLLDMGAQMTNTGGQIDCGYNVLPMESLRSEHQIMTGITQLTIACASVIEPGPQDFALFFDLSNTFLLGGVATVDISTPGPSPAPPGWQPFAGRGTPPREATEPTSPTGRP